MQPLIEEQPQPGQKLTGLRRPHEQFVYGCRSFQSAFCLAVPTFPQS